MDFLEVILNAGRNYVQGSQMLGRVSEKVAAPDTRLKSAAFRRITDRQVSMLRLDTGVAEPEGALGTIEYATSESSVRVALLEGEQLAPEGDLPPNVTWTKTTGQAALTADYELSGVHDLEDFVVAFVQTIKEEHAALNDEIRDIWFTGLRNANLPTDGAFPMNSGTLELRGGRVMGRDGAYQSMQTFSFGPMSGAVSFSFKSERQVHVA